MKELPPVRHSDHTAGTWYSYFELTPVFYSSSMGGNLQQLRCSGLYKGNKVSVDIVFDYTKGNSGNRISFVRTGDESDRLQAAMAELYDEELYAGPMKDTVSCSFYDGEPDDISLESGVHVYKMNFPAGKTGEPGSVEINLHVDLAKGIVRFGEKNSGMARLNFVQAFRK
ncbi:MAG TPA: hypothetical protein VFU15_15045 [Bacteroidia bacterium]|nr:hypothetical protein [Bacteroidia bacterium]